MAKKEDAPLGLCCALLAWVILLMAAFQYHEVAMAPLLGARAKTWASEKAWTSRTGEVLAAGVTSRGHCADEGPSVMGGLKNVSSLFPSSREYAFSLCPGWVYCASESNDGVCTCTGTVAFGPGLYGGKRSGAMDTPDLDNVLQKQGVEKSVQCTNSMFGEDLAVGTHKYCWCLDKAIVDVIGEQGPAQAQKCEHDGNNAFDAATIGNGATGLADMRPAGRPEQTGAAKRKDSELEVGLEEHMVTVASQRPLLGPRRLLQLSPGSADMYTCSDAFTPWALVKVSGGSLHAKEQIRCAYSYGAEKVSRESDWHIAHSKYLVWQAKIGSEMACESYNDCTIALSPLDSLASEETSNIQWPWTECLVGVVLMCCAGAVPVEAGKEWAICRMFSLFSCVYVTILVLGLWFQSLMDPPDSGSVEVQCFLVFGGIGVVVLLVIPMLIRLCVGNRPAEARERHNGNEAPLLAA